MKERETSSQTPEQLLQFLDAQLELNRARRAHSRQGRGVILALGVLLILIGACAALFVLSSLVTDLPRPTAPEEVAQSSAMQP